MTFENTGNFNGIFYGKNVDFTGAFPPTETMKVNGKLLIANDGVDLGPQIRVGTITSPSGTLAIGYSAPNITMDLVGGFADLHTAKWIVNKVAGQGGNQLSIAAALAAAAAGDTIFVMPGTYIENLTLVAGVNIVAFTGDESTPNVTIVGKLTMTTAGTCTISNIRLQTNSDFLLQVSGSAASVVNLDNCYLNCANNTGISYTSSSASSLVNVINCSGNLVTTGIAFFSASGGGSLIFNNATFANSGGSTTQNSISSGFLVLINSNFASPVRSLGTAGMFISQSNIQTSVTAVTYDGSDTGNNACRYSSIQGGSASAMSISTSAQVVDCEIFSSATNAITGAGSITYGGLSFLSTSSNINVTNQSLIPTGPSAVYGSSNTGNTNTLTVTNSSNTASSASNIISMVGSSAGDATFKATVSGVTDWTWGIDNDVTIPQADPWVLSRSTSLGTTDVIRATTLGVTMPLQPCFQAYANANLVNVTGDGTFYTVLYNTELYDKGSNYTPATGIFQAPIAGIYKFTAQINVAGVVAASVMSIQFQTTSRNYFPTQMAPFPVSFVGGFYALTVTCDAIMALNDTCKVVLQVANGSKTVTLSGGAGGDASYFAGFLVS